MLPLWALWRGRIHSYEPVPWQMPKLDWFGVAIFGQITVGGLSGFEYVAILAGECRSASRTIGQSVVISAPIIALMFILGTSSVLTFVGHQPINVIGPIPQTLRAATGNSGLAASAVPFAIALLIARAIAAASLLLTGLTRLPMTAGWDHLAPGWFARLHPKWRTPVNSILFVTAVVMAVILLSMLGVREQEASQLLLNASIVHYAIAYVALFALPVFGSRKLRSALPGWLKAAAVAGMAASAIALLIAVYPVVDVVSRASYAAKISGVVVLTNIAGVALYRAGKRRSQRAV
jgi:amino acid transporter